MEPTKHCPRCDTTKDRETEFFVRRGGGTQSWCKDCMREYRRGRDRRRATLQVPYELRDQLVANAAANGTTMAQLLVRLITQSIRQQCIRPTCIGIATAERQLCGRCTREADAFLAARRQEVGV